MGFYISYWNKGAMKKQYIGNLKKGGSISGLVWDSMSSPTNVTLKMGRYHIERLSKFDHLSHMVDWQIEYFNEKI